MPEHDVLTKIHKPENWTVASSAERLALSPVASDVGKWCYETNTGVYYRLDSISPVTWTAKTGTGGGGGGGGTVTSVALTAASIFSVTGSPITSSGTLALALATQLANLVWAGPTSGGAATPTFRALVAADLPTHNHSAADITTGLLALARGGTGADLSATGGAGQVLKQTSVGGVVTVAALVAGDLPSHTHSASQITSGQLALAQGGTGADLSATGGTSRVLRQSTAGGAVTVSQLAASDISGLGSLATLSSINNGNWSGTALAIANGGTGQTSANAALNAFLPGQTGNAGKALFTDGTNASWGAVSGSGTVTSVGLSLPAELTVSGSPVTASGTLSAAWASQTANKFLASPNGSTGTPSFRVLVSADLPSHTHAASDITSGQIALARGGTGADLTATGGTSQVLRQSTVGGAVTVSQLSSSDVSGLGSLATLSSINNSNWSGTALAIANGGTGQTTAANAINALVPTQTGNSGKFLTTDGSVVSWATVSGSGTVTSVGLSLPSIFSVTGSPVTTSGTLTGTLANQNANLVFAGPTSGGAATPTFRALVSADLPLSQVVIPCKYATTANITLSGSQTIDNATPSDNDVILVKNQTTQTENGAYLYNSSGAWSRHSLVGTGVNVSGWLFSVYAMGVSGSNGDTLWLCTSDTGVIGTNNITFAQVGAGGGGVSDGDKGDITVSGGGTAWAVDARAITYAKIQAMATSRILGRTTASSGDIEELTAGNGLTLASGSLDTKTQMSITTDALGLKLSGDSASPGNYYEYGTNGSGTKGWQVKPLWHVPILARGNTTTWTNMQAVDTFFLGSSTPDTCLNLDLTGYTQVRFKMRLSTAGASGAKIRVRYHTSFTTTLATYSAIGTSEVEVDLTTAGMPSSGWIDLATGAKADVFVMVYGTAGDGVADPVFGNTFLEFR